jgi:hypothetical protein
MDRCFDAAIRLRAAGIVVAAALAPPTFADELRVTGNDCSASIRVEARDVRLSDVLKGIAQKLDFQLSFEAESDPLVTIDVSRDAVDVLALVAATQNISIAKARNARCPERERIAKVWILTKGHKAAASAAAQAPRTSAGNQARARAGAAIPPRRQGQPASEGEGVPGGGNPQ